MNTTHQQIELPELSDHAIKRMEKNIMGKIQTQSPKKSSRRTWITGLSLAAAFALGAFVAPLALGGLGAGNTVASESAAEPALAYDAPAQLDGSSMEAYPMDQSGGRASLDMTKQESITSDVAVAADSPTAQDSAARDIVKSANVELRVDVIRDAAEQIEAKVAALGGQVQTLSIGTNDGKYPEPRPVDAASPTAEIPDTYGYLAVRVPADQLESFLKDLGGYGTVISSNVSADDQTNWGNELRSQIEAGEASLKKLNELMGQATNLSDVITLEQAITDRQAQLDWQQQSLNDLESRVAMSDVWINLSTPAEVAKPDSGGFVDGLKAGWNAFVASLYSVVVAVAFIVPWVLLIGIPVWLIWWFIKRQRANRNTKSDE